MESCLAGKPERVGPVEVDDIRRDLLGEFTALPAQVCLCFCLSLCLNVRLCLSLALRQAQQDVDCSLSVVSHQDGVRSQSENLQVYLRVRPFTAAESDGGESQVLHTRGAQFIDCSMDGK